MVDVISHSAEAPGDHLWQKIMNIRWYLSPFPDKRRNHAPVACSTSLVIICD